MSLVFLWTSRKPMQPSEIRNKPDRAVDVEHVGALLEASFISRQKQPSSLEQRHYEASAHVFGLDDSHRASWCEFVIELNHPDAVAGFWTAEQGQPKCDHQAAIVPTAPQKIGKTSEVIAIHSAYVAAL